MKVRRYDFLKLDAKIRRNDNGFLRAPVTATRTGIFIYRQADGSEFREYRSPDEVFNADSLESLRNVPVTNTHPTVPVNSSNARQFAIGMTSDRAERVENHVKTDVTIFDADAIIDVEGGRQQVSCGYDCDLLMEAGVINGERYDAVQRNIRYNHLALVDKGRAGPSAKLHLDHGDAFQESEGVDVTFNQKKGEQAMTKVKIDGVDYESSEQLAAAVVAFQKKCDDAVAKKDSEIADLRSSAKKIDTIQAHADSLEADNKKLKEEAAKRNDSATIQEAVKARLALVTKASAHVDEETAKKFDAMSDREIKVAAIKATCSEFSDKDKSDVYVDARFDHVSEVGANKSDDDLKKGLKKVNESRGDDGKGETADQIRARRMKEDSEAWQKPIGTTQVSKE